jgi:hypothetical protein
MAVNWSTGFRLSTVAGLCCRRYAHTRSWLMQPRIQGTTTSPEAKLQECEADLSRTFKPRTAFPNLLSVKDLYSKISVVKTWIVLNRTSRVAVWLPLETFHFRDCFSLLFECDITAGVHSFVQRPVIFVGYSVGDLLLCHPSRALTFEVALRCSGSRLLWSLWY